MTTSPSSDGAPRERNVQVLAQKYADHVSPAFIRLLGVYGYGRVFTSGHGLELTDAEGRTYTDFLAGFGTTALGHNPPRLIEAMQRALADGMPHVTHTGPNRHAAELAEAFAARVPHLPMTLFSLSGGEAVEASLKLARAATGRASFVYAAGGFHGTGLANLSVMGHARWKRPFQPLLPECHAVPFGDLPALERALSRHRPAAFLVEPIQAEAGVVMPPAGYLAAVGRACKKAGTLFILDEVQTGMGRTGKLFAFQHEEGVEPDAVVVGKGLGGGLLPVAATLARREHVERAYGSMWNFDLHGSTYAGYAMGCRLAREILDAVGAPDFQADVREKSERLVSGLRRAVGDHPAVKSVRGRGLMVGLELGASGKRLVDRVLPAFGDLVAKQVLGQWLAVRLLERGFVCQPASQEWNVLKLTPPLVITDAAIDALVATVGDILGEYRDFVPLFADVAARMAEQAARGGRFR
jgi:putrescine aminotransferase